MPWVLSKEFRFEAAHQLPHHDGKCARLHGHSFRLRVDIKSDAVHTEGPKYGMVVDYGDIAMIVKPLIDEKLDHWFLNESLGLESPTSELVAQWVYDWLKTKLKGLHSVTIHETCTTAATYSEEVQA